MSELILRHQDGVTRSGPFEFTAAGLAVEGEPTFEQWEECGQFLQRAAGAVQWWVGDWLNYGERRYGETYAQAIAATGLEEQTLMNIKWVAGKVETSRRRENLSFRHHAEVAALPPEQADAILTLADANGLSVRQVRQLARQVKEDADVEEPVEPNASPDFDHDFTVDHADCLAWFAAQSADSIDLVFGSPPYEDARLYLEEGSDPGIARGTEEWVAWMVDVYKAALRCCKGLVAFVVEGRTKDYRWSASPALLIAALVKEGINVRKPPLYKRVGIPGSGGPDWLRNDYEFIVCATRGGQLPWSDNTALGKPPKFEPGGDPTHRTVDGTRVNEGNGYASMEDRNNLGPHRARQRAGRVYQPPELANPGNVIECVAGGGNMGHSLCHENEAPFPEAIAEFFVRSFCPRGGVVCDPFSGSGTTGAVAVRHLRKFRGCDLRASQVRLSRKRIGKVQPELPLEG